MDNTPRIYIIKNISNNTIPSQPKLKQPFMKYVPAVSEGIMRLYSGGDRFKGFSILFVMLTGNME
ncbi:MAG: hypothetical protein MUC93_11180 [Bacteroidales bacterium]|nr:hypothetical protein [Bacteroidales bacterium]